MKNTGFQNPYFIDLTKYEEINKTLIPKIEGSMFHNPFDSKNDFNPREIIPKPMNNIIDNGLPEVPHEQIINNNNNLNNLTQVMNSMMPNKISQSVTNTNNISHKEK